MEQYWTNERNEIPKGELEFWALRRGAPVAAPSVEPEPAMVLGTVLRRVVASAWLGIALGFGMEALILAGKVSAGARPTVAGTMVELAQGIAWAFLVCAAIGLASTLGRFRASFGALTGLVLAPMAAYFAAAGQRLVAGAFDITSQPALLSLTTVGVLRAAEYAMLGWGLAALVARGENAMRRYVWVGTVIGLLFGGLVVMLTTQAAASMGDAMPLADMVALAISEILFPVGCALVAWIAMQVGRRPNTASAVSANV